VKKFIIWYEILPFLDIAFSERFGRNFNPQFF